MEAAKDGDLIRQLQENDLEALGLLYDRHQRMVYRTALAITGDPDAAADLLQDVFLRLHRFAHHVDPERPLEPWLYRTTANLAYTLMKRNRRWFHPLEDLADWLSGGGRNMPQEEVERKDDWDQMQRALAGLPFPQRVVVVLYYLNDLSLHEIANILDLPIGTVKSRLHYGRLGLRHSLGLAGLDGDALPGFNYENF
jgi:RNA polymerase sigma-70 factor (ECF subfamily)